MRSTKIFTTQNSVYEVDESSKLIRRLHKGDPRSAPQSLDDGTWKPYEACYVVPSYFGGRLVVELSDGTSFTTSTLEPWKEEVRL